MAINWRERFLAAAIHFAVTLLLAGLAAAIIFYVWFPGALATMIGGTKLFLMVIGIDIALGPLISLVIYSSKKPRRELLIDYSVVGIVQIAALVYGMSTVAASRPVFMVFHGQRLEVVRAIDLDDADLALGVAPEFKSKSWLGPRWVAVQMPTDVKERNDLVFSAVNGRDAELMPKYYRDFATAAEAVIKACKPLATLRAEEATEQSQLEHEVASVSTPVDETCWLMIHHRFGFGTALLDKRSKHPVKLIAINPSDR